MALYMVHIWAHNTLLEEWWGLWHSARVSAWHVTLHQWQGEVHEATWGMTGHPTLTTGMEAYTSFPLGDKGTLNSIS